MMKKSHICFAFFFIVISSVTLNVRAQEYSIHFSAGEEIKTGLQHFVFTHNLNNAFVITAVGTVKRATLLFAPLIATDESTAQVQTIEEVMYICSLSGTLGLPDLNVHVVLGRSDGTTIGGHVLGDLVVADTADVVIGNAGDVNSRQLRPFTGQTFGR